MRRQFQVFHTTCMYLPISSEGFSDDSLLLRSLSFPSLLSISSLMFCVHRGSLCRHLMRLTWAWTMEAVAVLQSGSPGNRSRGEPLTCMSVIWTYTQAQPNIHTYIYQKDMSAWEIHCQGMAQVRPMKFTRKRRKNLLELILWSLQQLFFNRHYLPTKTDNPQTNVVTVNSDSSHTGFWGLCNHVSQWSKQFNTIFINGSPHL